MTEAINTGHFQLFFQYLALIGIYSVNGCIIMIIILYMYVCFHCCLKCLKMINISSDQLRDSLASRIHNEMIPVTRTW